MIVTLNSGSSSLRCSVFERAGGGLHARLRLNLRGLPSAMIWERVDVATGEKHGDRLDPPEDPGTAHHMALAVMRERLLKEVDAGSIAAVSHRVVHGGRVYREPVRVTAPILAELAALSPLAPSHQPHNLAAIRDMAELFPGVPQVACFDTAFHHSLPPEDRVFALPKGLAEEGVIRYGFHGLSYEHIAGVLGNHAPEIAGGRVIVAHLGHGASMCALKGRRSVATTMGMTALDGLPMGKRSGALDPGVVLFLIEERGMSPSDVHEMLYERSGLLGLSGISDEMTELLASESADAKAALRFFVYRCQREIGSLAAALGGLDGLVFTGGIGEHSPEIRARICEGLGWLGITLDPKANAAGATWISAAGAIAPTLMIPTDEETVLAYGAERVLQSAPRSRVQEPGV